MWEKNGGGSKNFTRPPEGGVLSEGGHLWGEGKRKGGSKRPAKRHLRKEGGRQKANCGIGAVVQLLEIKVMLKKRKGEKSRSKKKKKEKLQIFLGIPSEGG